MITLSIDRAQQLYDALFYICSRFEDGTYPVNKQSMEYLEMWRLFDVIHEFLDSQEEE